MIHRLSEAQFPLRRTTSNDGAAAAASASSSSAVKQSWLSVINELLHHADPPVASLAIEALPHFCSAYLHPDASDDDENESSSSSPSSSSPRSTLVRLYQDVVKNALQEKSCQGHCLALAALPKFMFQGHLTSIVETLCAAASLPVVAAATPKPTATAPITTTPTSTVEWADARRDAVKALAEVVSKVGFGVSDGRNHAANGLNDTAVTPALFESIFGVVLASLGDYTTDSRGDVGSLVREAGVVSLQRLVCFAASSSSSSSLLTPDFVSSAMKGIVQQSCEKINRTRAIAGKAFAAILWHEPEVPNVPEMTRLRAVFTREMCGFGEEESAGKGDQASDSRIDWSSPASTFPLFR